MWTGEVFSDRVVIRIKQEAIIGVKGRIIFHQRGEYEGLEEPCRVRQVPFRRTGIIHRLNASIFTRQIFSKRVGLRSHGLKSRRGQRYRAIVSGGDFHLGCSCWAGRIAIVLRVDGDIKFE